MTSLGRVAVRAEQGPAGTVLSHLESSGLIAARATPWGVFLVSAGAGPLGGDELHTDIHVAKGANLLVRSVGATLALRGPLAHSISSSTVHAVLDEGAGLALLPEPGIASRGARHRSILIVGIAESARLCVRDEVVLGRIDEEPGTWWNDRAVSVDGHPLLVSELGLGPDATLWNSPHILGSARALSSLLLVHNELAGASAETDKCDGAVGACLPLSGPGVEIMAFGRSLQVCRKLVARLAARFLATWPINERGSEHAIDFGLLERDPVRAAR